jgi:hypothetical protein
MAANSAWVSPSIRRSSRMVLFDFVFINVYVNINTVFHLRPQGGCVRCITMYGYYNSNPARPGPRARRRPNPLTGLAAALRALIRFHEAHPGWFPPVPPLDR